VLREQPRQSDRERVVKEGAQPAVVDGGDNPQVAVLLVIPEAMELDVMGDARR